MDKKIAYFYGDQLEYVNHILHTYFNSTGFELHEIIESNKDYYRSRNPKERTNINACEFFMDKEILVDYPAAIYDKLVAFTQSKDYLITEDRQDTIIWLLYEFYSYNFSNTWLLEAIQDLEYYDFYTVVRPDMLRLFKSMHSFFTKDKPFDELKRTAKPVKIVYGNKEISLGNEDNWFFLHLKEYLEKYLKEKTIEEVEAEIRKYKRKAGVKSDHNQNRIVTQLYHFLQEETPYHDPRKRKTDKICTFIARFLEIMGYITIVPDTQEFDIKKEERKRMKTLKDWIATIRTKISENLKYEEIHGPYKSEANEILDDATFKPFKAPEDLNAPLRPKYW